MLPVVAVTVDELGFRFQWAPTLGGECYNDDHPLAVLVYEKFQWAPTLGGECYNLLVSQMVESDGSFNGHPPLGVNATRLV